MNKLKQLLSWIKPEIYYSCVLDDSELFYNQTLGLLASLFQIPIKPKFIFVHYTLGVKKKYLNNLKSTGVNLIPIERFGDGKYCNKLRQLETEQFWYSKYTIFLDTDMIVLKDVSEVLKDSYIKGKIVDLPNPDLKILKEIYDLAGFNSYPLIKEIPGKEKGETFINNFNGGLYIIPGKFIKQLRWNWQSWAEWLTTIDTLTKCGKEAHIDQISFSLATFDLKLPVQNLADIYNYPIHLSDHKIESPKIIHYHRQASENFESLNMNGTCNEKFLNALVKASTILKSRNNIFLKV